MRVLQIVHGNEAGGVKTLSEVIGNGLAARDIAVETAYLFSGFNAGILGKIRGTGRVARQIVSGRYDAIIAYQASASILTGVLGWIARCPHRIVHQTALPDEVKAPMRWLDRIVGTLGFYTANIVNSHATAAALARYPARYRRVMMMIEHGVALPRPAHLRAETLSRFAVPDDRRILFNIGRLTDQKNQEVLIQALVRVPTARLVIAGGGPRRAEYEALAARIGVADRLHLLGDVTRDDIADLLAASDLFVFPSVWETFGLAAVEAAMAGLPIVAADLPVLREVLSSDHGAAAVFVAPSDVSGWTAAIASAAEMSPAKRQPVVDAVAQRYSVARMVDAYAALLATDRPGASERTTIQNRAACRVSGSAEPIAPHGTRVAKPSRDSAESSRPVPIQDRRTRSPRHRASIE
jgi:glycosyltransferase involved in cell wall biosynthesis